MPTKQWFQDNPQVTSYIPQELYDVILRVQKIENHTSISKATKRVLSIFGELWQRHGEDLLIPGLVPDLSQDVSDQDTSTAAEVQDELSELKSDSRPMWALEMTHEIAELKTVVGELVSSIQERERESSTEVIQRRQEEQESLQVSRKSGGESRSIFEDFAKTRPAEKDKEKFDNPPSKMPLPGRLLSPEQPSPRLQLPQNTSVRSSSLVVQKTPET